MNTKSFLSRFSLACEANPERTAFQFSDSSFTYREFAGIVQGIRAHLESNVPETERRIAIFASQDVHTYASILAVLATGRSYVPLNPATPADRNLNCLRQADTATLLCTRRAPAIQRWETEETSALIVIETQHLNATGPLTPIAAPASDSMAYLLFTSGSTGVPKGVPIYHRNVDAFLNNFVDLGVFAFDQNDKFLQMFDLTFDLSVMSFAVPLSVGAACCVVSGDGPGYLAVIRTLEKGAVTVALMVPSVLTFLQRYFEEIRLPALRLCLFCGEALPSALARSWWKCVPSARLINAYGPTEATIFCSTYEMPRDESAAAEHQGVVSIGRAFPGTILRVVDDSLESVAAGVKGELVIAGDQVTDQYWLNAERTSAAFVALPDGLRGYRSGDLVYSDGDLLFYSGRIDNQIKVDGYRIESGDVEHHARLLEGVQDAVLCGISGAAGGTVLHLFLLASNGRTADVMKADRAVLAKQLPSYMVPQRLHARVEFPLNQNGKVDRKALLSSILGAE